MKANVVKMSNNDESSGKPSDNQGATAPNVSARTNPVIAVAPKRDKLAAMVARQGAAPLALEIPTAAATTTAAAATDDATSEPSNRAAKRDKFAAMGARRGNCNSSASQVLSQNVLRTKETTQRVIVQRDGVWKDLERAQALAVRLLQVAQETAAALGRPQNTSFHLLKSLATQYQTTVAAVHTCLAPHAHFVTAYRTTAGSKHTKNNNTTHNRMYTNRVELQMAASRKALLQDMLALEKKGIGTEPVSSRGTKRQRSEE
jgi:hypothetical protein